MEEDILKSYLAYTTVNDKFAAGIILVKNGNNLIAYIAASDIELNRKYGASSFLFWKSMMWAKEQGMEYFDFGGIPSDINPDGPAYGVYRFKKNFGGDLIQFPTGEKILSQVKAKIFNKILNSRSIIRFLMRFSNKF